MTETTCSICGKKLTFTKCNCDDIATVKTKLSPQADRAEANSGAVPGYGTPLAEIKDPDVLREMVDTLWSLLDHIDTLDDACRDNDKCFRNNTRKYQRERMKVLESDGYNLFAPVA
jgi:hypothetical protein